MSEPKVVLSSERLTERLMKELNLQDRAGTILKVIDTAHENAARLSDALARDPRLTEEARQTATETAKAIRSLKKGP